MGLARYLFDTYALIELIKKNPSYLELKEVDMATTKLNLMELHYYLLRTKSAEIARIFFDKYNDFIVEIEDSVIIEANAFRYANKKKKLSYADCIGYILSRRTGAKFLTGDNAFKGMEGVEFLK